MLTRSEVSQHGSKKSCWVVINNVAYDLTSFLDEHPGGIHSILRYAGKDATATFNSIHPSDTIQKYMKPQHIIGPVDAQDEKIMNSDTIQPPGKRITLRSIINIRDFEKAAAQRLSPEAFAFFRAGADDEHTVNWNRKSWQLLRFCPQILRPIINIDLSTSIFGQRFSLPFFISPAGAGKLAHPDGEVLMTKATAKHDALQWVCNMAGCTKEEIARARAPDQTLFWQIYAKGDLSITESEIKEAIRLGYKGFALTVDAVRAGKRERDMRMTIDQIEDQQQGDTEDYNGDSVAPGGISAARGALWTEFDWLGAIQWLRNLTDLPIAIKGIQCWEDAATCMQYNVHPWLSNHGGRQLEGAPSAVEALLEIRQHCPEVFQKCNVLVDGGIMRGTDIVKAIALGAKAVGVGRPFLYALSFGEAGVDKAICILKQEVETAMALLGVCSIDQLNPSHVKLRCSEYKL